MYECIVLTNKNDENVIYEKSKSRDKIKEIYMV